MKFYEPPRGTAEAVNMSNDNSDDISTDGGTPPEYDYPPPPLIEDENEGVQQDGGIVLHLFDIRNKFYEINADENDDEDHVHEDDEHGEDGEHEEAEDKKSIEEHSSDCASLKSYWLIPGFDSEEMIHYRRMAAVNSSGASVTSSQEALRIPIFSSDSESDDLGENIDEKALTSFIAVHENEEINLGHHNSPSSNHFSTDENALTSFDVADENGESNLGHHNSPSSNHFSTDENALTSFDVADENGESNLGHHNSPLSNHFSTDENALTSFDVADENEESNLRHHNSPSSNHLIPRK